MVFSGGFHGTPLLCTNGSAGYLMQLSVKAILHNFFESLNLPKCNR